MNEGATAPIASDDPTGDNIYAKVHKWISRHFVSLNIVYRHLDDAGNPEPERRVGTCSSSVLSVGKLWFLATAGHVIQELDALVNHPRVLVEETFLVDSLGVNATHLVNIPFSYRDSPRHSVFEDGLDFGIISLSANERSLMMANGVEPIPLSNWTTHDVDKCCTFALLGMPAEFVTLETRDVQGVRVGTMLVSLTRLRDLPAGADRTEHERFIGEIQKELSLQSLGGTSGGPIIGFELQENGEMRYSVVAIQSKCLGNRYIFGCYTKYVGMMILETLRGIFEEVGSGSAE